MEFIGKIVEKIQTEQTSKNFLYAYIITAIIDILHDFRVKLNDYHYK